MFKRKIISQLKIKHFNIKKSCEIVKKIKLQQSFQKWAWTDIQGAKAGAANYFQQQRSQRGAE